jgi:hypothetical protein
LPKGRQCSSTKDRGSSTNKQTTVQAVAVFGGHPLISFANHFRGYYSVARAAANQSDVISADEGRCGFVKPFILG